MDTELFESEEMVMEKRVFRNNAEMMAYLRGKVEKLEPLNVRDTKKKKKAKKKDVGKAE